MRSKLSAIPFATILRIAKQHEVRVYSLPPVWSIDGIELMVVWKSISDAYVFQLVGGKPYYSYLDSGVYRRLFSPFVNEATHEQLTGRLVPPPIEVPLYVDNL